MTVTAHVYAAFIDHLAHKRVNVGSDTLKAALVTSAYSALPDSNAYFSDVTNEATGTGYTAGGASLSSVTWTYTAGTKTWALDAADVSWASSTITARYLVIYDSTPGTAATDPLICYIDFGTDVSSTSGTFTVTFNATGILTVTIS